MDDEQQSEQETESVEVTVKLLKVTAQDINALDDDWAKQLSDSISNESDLYSYVQKDMEYCVKTKSMATLADQVFLELQRLYRVSIPPNLLDAMVDQAREQKSRVAGTDEHRKHNRSHNQVHSDGDARAPQSDDQHVEEPVEQPIELEASDLEEIETYLLRRVHVNAFAFAKRIEINSTRVQVEVEQRMAYLFPERVSNSRLQEQWSRDLNQRIFYEHMERQVVQGILDEATIKDVPCSYEDLMSGKF